MLLAAAGLGLSAYLVLRNDEHGERRPAAAGATASATKAAPPRDPNAPDPLKAVLMTDSVVELEAELERAAVLSGRDAKALNVAMTNYHRRARAVPPGKDPQEHRRAVLAELILAWMRDPAPTQSTASIAELEAVFLRMNSPLDVKERRDMLHELKLREGAGSELIRTRLLEWIEQRGLDYQTGEPGAELVLEDEPATSN